MKKTNIFLILFVICIAISSFFYSTTKSKDNKPAVNINLAKPESATHQQLKKQITRSASSNNTLSQAETFQALDINDLLDEEDKTALNKQFIQNHNNLLTLLHKLHTERDKSEILTAQEVRQWLQILINDIYFTNQFYLNREVAINIEQIDFYDPSLIPADNAISPRLDENHLKTLKKLIVELEHIETIQLSKFQSDYFIPEIASLLKNSKQQSQVFYLTLMRKYFPGQNYPLQEKIYFARSFINAGDKKLVKYSLDYFKNAYHFPEYANDKKKIQQFSTELTKGLTS